ncbi:MAG TPA: FAD-dependent oxidoreductase, partial [Balneolaceae bacterium]
MSFNFQPSFWESDSFLKPYDLIIIGAGIVGLSTALFYKKEYPKARVAVLERGFIPQGASTRNAGFACVGSITEHLADLKKESEENIKRRIVQRYEGLKLLKKTLGEQAIGYEPCGGYELFTSQEEFENAASEIDRFNGWMSELVGEESVYHSAEMEGYPVIYNRLEGALHPGKMMQELVGRVNSSGVEIKWNSPVQKVAEAGTVVLENGIELKAKKVLFAANGFVSRLLPDLDIKPARGLVFITNEQENLPWKGTFHYDEGYIYFRNVKNRLLIGGARNLAADDEETDHFGTNETIKKHLVKFVSEVLKLPDGWQVQQEWSGIM